MRASHAMEAFLGSPRSWQLLVGSFFPDPGLSGIRELVDELEGLAEQAFQDQNFRSATILYGCLLRFRWSQPSRSDVVWIQRFSVSWGELGTHPCRPRLDIILWLIEGLAAKSGVKSVVYEAIEQFLVGATPWERDVVVAAMSFTGSPM